MHRQNRYARKPSTGAMSTLANDLLWTAYLLAMPESPLMHFQWGYIEPGRRIRDYGTTRADYIILLFENNMERLDEDHGWNNGSDIYEVPPHTCPANRFVYFQH